jgi:hypothetical protein
MTIEPLRREEWAELAFLVAFLVIGTWLYLKL